MHMVPEKPRPDLAWYNEQDTGLRRSAKFDCQRPEVCEMNLCICSGNDNFCHSELCSAPLAASAALRGKTGSNYGLYQTLYTGWNDVINCIYHDFETLHKSRSLQLFPKFRQLSLDQTPLHVTLPMSIWFSLYTNVVYRLVVLPSKNRTPTRNSHSILIIKICNIIQPLLFSFILTYLNSQQQQGLALFSKTPKEM